MSENKFTPGPWQKSFLRAVCIGVEKPLSPKGYAEMICNSMLPDNDKEYRKQKKNIEANMNLIATAPELLQALIEAREMLIASGMKEDSVGLIGINNVIKKATE